jgi:hypothetical protein
MAKKPKNIEWIVTGRAQFVGASCIVHAMSREEAMQKATNGAHFGEIDFDGASLTDFRAARAEPNVGD